MSFYIKLAIKDIESEGMGTGYCKQYAFHILQDEDNGEKFFYVDSLEIHGTDNPLFQKLKHWPLRIQQMPFSIMVDAEQFLVKVDHLQALWVNEDNIKLEGIYFTILDNFAFISAVKKARLNELVIPVEEK